MASSRDVQPAKLVAAIRDCKASCGWDFITRCATRGSNSWLAAVCYNQGLQSLVGLRFYHGMCHPGIQTIADCSLLQHMDCKPRVARFYHAVCNPRIQLYADRWLSQSGIAKPRVARFYHVVCNQRIQPMADRWLSQSRIAKPRVAEILSRSMQPGHASRTILKTPSSKQKTN